jgi:hypothetical protein
MKRTPEEEKQYWLDRSYQGIPSDEKLTTMSDLDLVVALYSCEKDSPKFRFLDREMKKRLAKDQARINKQNVIIGGLLSGIFSLLGVVLGWWLRGP